MWINKTGAGTGNYGYLLDIYKGGGNNRIAFSLDSDSDQMRYIATSAQAYTDTATLNNGQWYLITMTYDGSTIRRYRDGNLINETTASLQDGSLSGVTLGRPYDVVNNYFYNGKLDETRVYNRALSPGEVAQLYNFAPGPYAYYSFDEGSGSQVFDKSGNGFTANWSGSNTHWAPGKFGNAARFYGNFADYLRPTALTAPSRMPITFSFWVKPNTSSISGLYDSAPGQTNVLRVYDPEGGIQWWGSPTRSVSLTAGEWTHIGIIYNYDGANRILSWYKNGVFQSSSTVAGTSTFAWSSSSFTFGNINGSYTPYSGMLDEFKIYNYARSAKQIVEDMNGGHPAGGSPVGSALGKWSFDEGADNRCSGGANDTCNTGSGGSTLDGAQSGMAVPATSTSGWTNSGKFGKALNFDGSDDYVNLVDNVAWDMTGMTLSAWVYPRTFSDGDKIMLRDDASSDRIWQLQLSGTGGAVQFLGKAP